MAAKKRRTGRPRLTIVRGNGSMQSVPMPRRGSPSAIDGLPTRIYFPRGSSTPTAGSLAVLLKYARWLMRHRARRLWVVGHANRRQRGRSSLALANTRVRAVRDLLIWLGAGRGQVRRVSPSRLHALRPGSTRAERASHRSVELIVGPTGELNFQAPLPRARARTRRRAA